ncbi:glycoside hydrolase family 99-like domain-containing protein [Lachnospiraceae bacterium YH-ros2226]
MKIYSLFLPQFYETKENDEWWGKGFTEWVNVKNAKPLFNGHKQPKHPLNNNYYCMLDKSTVEWQTSLMHKYGISGLVYYHYYFDGKLLLEKPAENLLKWKDIDQEFFFCWANHTWYRSWEGKKTILQAQTYGTTASWKHHFEYLLPFFKDPRYTKIDNRPLFMIYDVTFPELEEMINYFDVECKKNGFNGIKIIRECTSYQSVDRQLLLKNDDYIFMSSPAVARVKMDTDKIKLLYYWDRIKYRLCQRGIIKKVQTYRGNDLYDVMISQNQYFTNKRIIPGIFFEWDNTSRHKQRGYIISHVEKAKFMQYMSKIKNADFAIVNAWNEWCEDMILEPTEEDGYRNLEWIKEFNDSQS